MSVVVFTGVSDWLYDLGKIAFHTGETEDRAYLPCIPQSQMWDRDHVLSPQPPATVSVCASPYISYL